MGAAGIPLARLPAALGLWGDAAAGPTLARDQLVLWSIRIPRIAAAAMVGALLAASGAIMQGLFRNPLADPALVGVSSGGALAAAAAIVFTDSQIGQSFRFMQHHLLPIAAFAGSLVTTVILYSIASRSGRTSIAIFLLAGIAIAAIANAGVGLLVFIADDRQLRDITFWMLGSLSGATWPKLATLAPVLGLALIACVSIARGLDVLVLGEAEAFHSGVDVERLKRISIVLVSAMTGRCGFGLRRGRLCRHRGAASAAAGDRAGAPAAAAGLDAVGRGAAGGRRYAGPHHRGARGNADRHPDGGDRRAVLPRRCCCASAGWFRYDRHSRSAIDLDDDRRRHAGRRHRSAHQGRRDGRDRRPQRRRQIDAAADAVRRSPPDARADQVEAARNPRLSAAATRPSPRDAVAACQRHLPVHGRGNRPYGRGRHRPRRRATAGRCGAGRSRAHAFQSPAIADALRRRTATRAFCPRAGAARLRRSAARPRAAAAGRADLQPRHAPPDRSGGDGKSGARRTARP